MDNKEFSKKMEERTKKFAISIVKLSSSLPITIEYKVIKYQLSKSGTSVGANYREANRARSKADFSNKIKIGESESSETSYWLEIILELNELEQKKYIANELYNESEELLAIFTSISSKLKK